ncbi:Glu-tRNA(Gln) amidotransferase subunit GatD [Candidatus Woesearchaeota archaeon]|nr:Glu-tRNA(Gln) amidotransferase subunit GatD [Candidatus Woesearchaeota archaeon]
MHKAGDRVRIVTNDESIEGILLPDESHYHVVKLDSGYNIGVDKKRVKDVKVLEAHKEKREKEHVVAAKKGLPSITILHTGGTIASKVDYETGAVTSRFTPDEILALFPELRDIANIDSRLVRNMASDDMRFAHYNILAKEVEKEVAKGVKGVIITHGTDTLHYTGAALSFALRNLPIPVILVGSQRSSDRGSSDAGVNLISAATFIAATDFAGVGVCMHETTNDTTCVILPGVKCRKMHSSRRDAFRAINTTPWARVDHKTKNITFLRTDYPRPNGTFNVKPFKETLKVGLAFVHTNMYAEEFACFKGWDGLVIAGTGLGHAPISEIDAETKEHPKIFNAIKQLITAGTIVAMTTQTIYGQVDMNVYAPGRKLLDLGVLGNLADMHPETAFIKLAWLLSNYPAAEATRLYGVNIAGELSERLEPGTFP